MDENEVMQTETVDTWDDDYLSDEVFTDESGDTEEDLNLLTRQTSPKQKRNPSPPRKKRKKKAASRRPKKNLSRRNSRRPRLSLSS